MADAETVDEAVAEIRRDGFSVLKGVIPGSEVGGVRDAVAAAVHAHSLKPPPKGYVPGFLRRNQAIATYLADERILGVARSLLGDHIKISMLTGVVNGPGIPRDKMHADWPYNQSHQTKIPAPYPDIVVNLVTMWMLTDYRVDNGGTAIIPGSHLRPDSPRPGGKYSPAAVYEGETNLTGSAGDVGIFDARLWHAVASNLSSADRVGCIVRYCPWWLNLNPLRPGHLERRVIVDAHNGTDAQVDPLPAAIYAHLPAAVQRLVYHMVEGEVAAVGELQL